ADPAGPTRAIGALRSRSTGSNGAENIDWAVLLGASVISLIPMVLLFLVFRRQIMNSDINSGLKD
ncbi:MAG: hypothetical protein ACTH1T_15245, partial [Brachybacterium tyrofermentans]